MHLEFIEIHVPLMYFLREDITRALGDTNTGDGYIQIVGV